MSRDEEQPSGRGEHWELEGVESGSKGMTTRTSVPHLWSACYVLGAALGAGCPRTCGLIPAFSCSAKNPADPCENVTMESARRSLGEVRAGSGWDDFAQIRTTEIANTGRGI